MYQDLLSEVFVIGKNDYLSTLSISSWVCASFFKSNTFFFQSQAQWLGFLQ
jgi:hypothetical protein